MKHNVTPYNEMKKAHTQMRRVHNQMKRAQNPGFKLSLRTSQIAK